MPSAPLDGDDPRPLGRVAVLRHLVQVGLGEEACVGHQALVHGAELVDAEFGVGDEAAVFAPGLLAQQQVSQHTLERRVPQSNLIDQRGRRGQEQVEQHQAVEDQAVACSPCLAAGGSCPLIDQPNSRASESCRCVPLRRAAG